MQQPCLYSERSNLYPLLCLLKNLFSIWKTETFHKCTGAVAVSPFLVTNHGACLATRHPGDQENREEATFGCVCPSRI